MLHGQLMTAAFLALPMFSFYPGTGLPATGGMIEQRSTALAAALQIRSGNQVNGINTARLSEKNLSRWKEIERLVFAQTEDNQPLHPTLRGMWEWLETSGHTVFIEFIHSGRNSTTTAGNFSIERYDPRGEHHFGVIRLNLGNIDLAYVGAAAAREPGFIPFVGLSKEERYAEVLGHEMAHAIDILTSPERAKNVEFNIEETNENLLRSRPRRKGEQMTPELSRALSKRDVLLEELEKRAESMEHIVWKELSRSRPLREKSRLMAGGQ
jgi:hypothetical protein